MIEELKNNIEIEIAMARQLSSFIERLEYVSQQERKMILGVVNSLIRRIKLINNSIPYLLKNISVAQKLVSEHKEKKARLKPKIETIHLKTQKKRVEAGAAIKSEDRDKFLEELNISENLLRKLKKREFKVEKRVQEFKVMSSYAKISNRFFLHFSESWIRRGKFKSLMLDIQRSNLNILTLTYISMMSFSILLSIFLGIFLAVFFLFFTIGFEWPLIGLFKGDFLDRFLKTFWIAFLVPLLTGSAFYFYPGAEKKSLAKRIDQELPFIVINMGSVSGSGIEPIEIFKIIGLSKEYKYAGKEIRKILNQTNIYGYNLTTSLINVARITPSTKLSELLTGMSVTIKSGGDIKTFFEKRAESLLLEYRLEREKFIKVAETFMDIYISLVIATPMILLLLLIMMSISGIGVGFGINEMTLAIIGIVAIVNVMFLTFLHLKQPGY